MGGTFQTTRDIFDNDIWQRPLEFRMFFYLYGHAMFKDGVKIAGLTLNRGQYLTSIRRLQSGLSYIENNGVKTHSLSVLWRTLKKLEKDDRLTYVTNGLGTLVSIKNYDSYQLFATSEGETWNADGTQMERSWNTDLERSWNNKNTGNKGNTNNTDNKGVTPKPAEPDNNSNSPKPVDLYGENKKPDKPKSPNHKYGIFTKVLLSDVEYKKLIDKFGETEAKDRIQRLDDYIGSKGASYKSHYRTILTWARKDDKDSKFKKETEVEYYDGM